MSIDDEPRAHKLKSILFYIIFKCKHAVSINQPQQ